MRADVVGVLLAGGRARRMGGGDKCLLTLGGATLLERAIARAAGQVDRLVLSINGDPARFARFGVATAGDPVGGYVGPLAGVLSGMVWARAHVPDARWVATFPTDSPFFPEDLVARLVAAVEAAGAEIGTVFSGGRAQPVFGLWPLTLADALRSALEESQVRKVDAWTGRYHTAAVTYEAGEDAFFNINRAEDLKTAQALMARGVGMDRG